MNRVDIRGKMLASVVLLLVCTQLYGVASMSAEDIYEHLKKKDEMSNFALSKLSYDQIVSLFYKLGADYPDYIRVFDAAEQMRDANLPYTRCFAPNSEEPERACQYVYATLTNFTNPAHVNFTQSFFSGNFHGDEVIGPNVIAYLARYLLEEPRLDVLNYSYIVLLPLGNPSGYFAENREEIQFTPKSLTAVNSRTSNRQLDMNRDFPYDSTSKTCFQSAGARVINMIWQKHLFTAAITFHGGMTAIGWPWGSTNHALRNQKGELAPDHHAMLTLGQRMSEAAGSGIDTPPYPTNTLTNAIYPVGGSFEDWSYAASWEREYSPKAFPHTCEGVSESEMFMNDSIARSLTYLIETSNRKMPVSSTYGTWKEINQPSKGVGHVSRNIRLTVDFIENLTPFHNASMAPQSDYKFFIKWDLNGCSQVESTKMYFRDHSITPNNKSDKTPIKYKSEDELLAAGFVLHKEMTNIPGAIQHSGQYSFGTIDDEYQIERDIEVALVSTCDPQWRTAPEGAAPMTSPQSHFVRSRLSDDYLAQNNGFSINGKKHIVETYGPYTLKKVILPKKIELDEIDLTSSTSDSWNLFAYILSALLVVGAIGSYLFYKCFKRLGRNQIDFEEVMDQELSSNRHHSDHSNRQIPSSKQY